MDESNSNDEVNYQLTTVNNPDLPDIEKPSLKLTFKEPNQNSYQDTNSAIVVSWIGVIVAGSLYPVLIILGGWVFFVFLHGLPADIKIVDVLGGILWLSFPAILGMFMAAIASALSCVLTVIINWSFGKVFTPRIAVSVSGGLAGFLATLPIWLEISHNPQVVLFSVLAMTMGHIGGMLAVWKIDPALLVPRPSTQSHYQFQIRHLLVATAWFAAIAAIDGTWGNLFFSMMIGTWLVAQALLILADFLWLKFWSKKRSLRISPSKTSL